MKSIKKDFKIELKQMEFYAHHGFFEEERTIGNKFIVNLSVKGYFTRAALSDNIEDALNYQELYDIVKEEMAKTSCLLENVADRIVNSIVEKFGEAFVLDGVEVTIDKLNPPLGGVLYASSVTARYPKDKTDLFKL